MGRLPDFVVIGAMKAGTTTIFRRLGQMRGVDLPEVKEPHFFSDSQNWVRGVEWYSSLFANCHQITGEASASYSDARSANSVANRMASVVPDVRIIYALRHPIDRLKSHYMHQVLRARERRPLDAALNDEISEYVARSFYGKVIEAYLQSFSSDQIFVYRLEDLDSAGSEVWNGILAHIGLPSSPMPEEVVNVSDTKLQFRAPLRWLWDSGLVASTRAPKGVRRVGKKLLTRTPDLALVESASLPVSPTVIAEIERDQRLLHALPGVSVAPYVVG